ncbi:hypothetical protein HK405_005392, partial [Cladochytrium tenue]
HREYYLNAPNGVHNARAGPAVGINGAGVSSDSQAKFEARIESIATSWRDVSGSAFSRDEYGEENSESSYGDNVEDQLGHLDIDSDGSTEDYSQFRQSRSFDGREKPIKLPRKRAHISGVPLPLPPPPLLPATSRSLVGTGLPTTNSVPPKGSGMPTSHQNAYSSTGSGGQSHGQQPRQRAQPGLRRSSSGINVHSRSRRHAEESRVHHLQSRQVETSWRNGDMGRSVPSRKGNGSIGSDSELSDEGPTSPQSYNFVRDHSTESQSSAESQFGGRRSNGVGERGHEAQNDYRGFANGGSSPFEPGSQPGWAGLIKRPNGFPALVSSVGGYDGSRDISAATASFAMSLGVGPPLAPHGTALPLGQIANPNSAAALALASQQWAGFQKGGGRMRNGFSGVVHQPSLQSIANGSSSGGNSSTGQVSWMYSSTSVSATAGVLSTSKKKKRLLHSQSLSPDRDGSRSATPTNPLPLPTDVSGLNAEPILKPAMERDPSSSSSAFLSSMTSGYLNQSGNVSHLAGQSVSSSSIRGITMGLGRAGSAGAAPPSIAIGLSTGTPVASKFEFGTRLPDQWPSPLNGIVGEVAYSSYGDLDEAEGAVDNSEEEEDNTDYSTIPVILEVMPKLITDTSQYSSSPGADAQTSASSHTRNETDQRAYLHEGPPQGGFIPGGYDAHSADARLRNGASSPDPFYQGYAEGLAAGQLPPPSTGSKKKKKKKGKKATMDNEPAPTRPDGVQPRNQPPPDGWGSTPAPAYAAAATTTLAANRAAEQQAYPTRVGVAPKHVLQSPQPYPPPPQPDPTQLRAQRAGATEPPSPLPPDPRNYYHGGQPGLPQPQPTSRQPVAATPQQVSQAAAGAAPVAENSQHYYQQPQPQHQQQHQQQQQQVAAPQGIDDDDDMNESVAESQTIMDGFTRPAVRARYRRARFLSVLQHEHDLRVAESFRNPAAAAAAAAVAAASAAATEPAATTAARSRAGSSGGGGGASATAPVLPAAPLATAGLGGFGGVGLEDEMVCFFCEFEHLFSRRAARRRRRIRALVEHVDSAHGLDA